MELAWLGPDELFKLNFASFMVFCGHSMALGVCTGVNDGALCLGIGMIKGRDGLILIFFLVCWPFMLVRSLGFRFFLLQGGGMQASRFPIWLRLC